MDTSRLKKKIKSGMKGRNAGIKTGNEIYDFLTGGVKKGKYYLYFADSGGGKSAFLVDLAFRILNNDKNKKAYIYYFNIEMSEEELQSRYLSRMIFDDKKKILSATDILSESSDIILSKEEYDEFLIPAIDKLEEYGDRFNIISKPIKSEFFEEELIKIGKKHGRFEKDKYIENNDEDYVIIFFDLINNIVPQKKEAMDYVSRLFYEYRNKCKFSCHVLQQANRGFKDSFRRQQGDNHFQSSDTKDTNNTVQDADLVIGIFFPLRENVPNHNSYPIYETKGSSKIQLLGDRFRDIQILKQRGGRSAQDIAMRFDGETNRFRELPSANEIMAIENEILDVKKFNIEYNKRLSKNKKNA